MMLAHTIEAVVNGRITRVHCNTCGGQHAYRVTAPGTGTGTRARTTRSRTTRAEPKPTRDYASLLRGRDPASARGYAATERYNANDLIQHPTFGLGLVTALKDTNKIEVVFPEGSKTLIHRR